MNPSDPGCRGPDRGSLGRGNMRVQRLVLAAFVVLGAGLSAAPALGARDPIDARPGLPDRDTRAGAVRPAAAQKADARALGAQVAWNRFGTPSSLVDPGRTTARRVGGGTPAA